MWLKNFKTLERRQVTDSNNGGTKHSYDCNITLKGIIKSTTEKRRKA